MGVKMTVVKGSSMCADTMTIVVEKDAVKVFEQYYVYGYTVSWCKFFACEEKPLDTDLIASVALEYGVSLEDVQYATGRNVFKESLK